MEDMLGSIPEPMYISQLLIEIQLQAYVINTCKPALFQVRQPLIPGLPDLVPVHAGTMLGIIRLQVVMQVIRNDILPIGIAHDISPPESIIIPHIGQYDPMFKLHDIPSGNDSETQDIVCGNLMRDLRIEISHGVSGIHLVIVWIGRIILHGSVDRQSGHSEHIQPAAAHGHIEGRPVLYDRTFILNGTIDESYGKTAHIVRHASVAGIDLYDRRKSASV